MLLLFVIYLFIIITVTNNNPAETKQIFRLSLKKLSKQNQTKKEQMPKMTPHVNSQEDLTSQQQAQSTPNQQVQQTQLPVQTGNNQSTPSQSAQQPQHTRKHRDYCDLYGYENGFLIFFSPIFNFIHFFFSFDFITEPTPHSQNQNQAIQQALPPQQNHPTNNCKYFSNKFNKKLNCF